MCADAAGGEQAALALRVFSNFQLHLSNIPILSIFEQSDSFGPRN